MSRYFMYGTSLGGVEQLMMLAPNFPQRRSGIVINNHFNCEGGIKICNGCVKNVKSRGKPNDCFCFKEKLEADEVEYIDLITDCFGRIKNYSLKERLKLLSNRFTGELFLNHNHKERFYQLHCMQDIEIWERSPSYLAVIFLLTADEVLWNISENAVCLNGFDFSQIHLRQISTEGYALYQTAKTISIGKEYIKISEIADRELIDDTGFKIIINASLIAKYGADVFSIKR
ncbi:MAG: hypothetical protein WC179_09390 [Candidatus Cloacimonadaceae bacterium]|jgi:hypothetical protein|uniref:hypothetical protein n=1 Tax=Aminipila sp. TaxID=2060095 RepID=UPI0028A1EC66|nr:hypothetical protein [Aminipila sp.]MDD4714850.1 hypothetical protein [Candidatus Absconditabacteria bacterium]